MVEHQHLPCVAVVIVNYRRAELTVACIRSVLAEGLQESQIILVDNGSGDGSVELIENEFPHLQIYALPENVGFARGYNFGIQQALDSTAEKIFLLNNDTLLEKGALHHLVQSEWDIAVPKIVYFEKPDVIWAAGCRWRRFPPTVVMIGYQKRDAGIYNQPSPLTYATGCALLVRREVLRELGGFDPAYTSYMEDYDFSYRAREAGFSMGYVPQAKILHKVSQTLGIASPERWMEQGKNTVLFYLRAGRFPGWILWMYLLWFTIRETIQLRFLILWHFWRGVRSGLVAFQNN